MTISPAQQKNYEYFSAHLAEFLTDPSKKAKYLVIKDESIKGAYDQFDAALKFAVATLGSDFVIQQAIDNKQTINYLACSR